MNMLTCVIRSISQLKNDNALLYDGSKDIISRRGIKLFMTSGHQTKREREDIVSLFSVEMF